MLGVDMNTLAQKIGLPEGYLLTRVMGESAYEILSAHLDSLTKEESLLLDFVGIQVIDVSFVDESIILLAKEMVDGKYEGHRMLLKNLSDDAIVNINAAIHLQKLRLSLLAIDADENWTLVGHIEKSLKQVFDLIMTRGSITAPTLAKEFDIAINASNNRLKRLLDQRLIRRDYEVTDNGLLYTYHKWDWTEENIR